jgi:hypothetical protein
MSKSQKEGERLPAWRLYLAGFAMFVVVATWMKLGVEQQPFNPTVALFGAGLLVLSTSDILSLCVPLKDLTHSYMRLLTGLLSIAAVFSYVIN